MNTKKLATETSLVCTVIKNTEAHATEDPMTGVTIMITIMTIVEPVTREGTRILLQDAGLQEKAPPPQPSLSILTIKK